MEEVNQFFLIEDLAHISLDQINRNRNFVYEAVKLKKKMAKRYLNNKKIEGVDSVDGLERIFKSKPPNHSFLHHMFQSEESKCDFLILVAMYNEGPKEFESTLTGIFDNLKNFENHERVACIFIVDGMKPFLEANNKKKKNDSEPCLSSKFYSQFFDIEFVTNKFNPEKNDLINCTFDGQIESDEFAHCFIQKIKMNGNDTPLNLVFCVKQFNKRKLNSQLWFFGGFCKMIQPKFVMLLDVGTKPLDMSLYYLYEALNNDEKLAGCCGEIIPMDCKLSNFVISAQMAEYKFSHIFDKALESMIGYITVLPGAFSAYRWNALNGSPLWEDYFKSIFHPELMDTFQSNIYLAEDRVLCLSLFTKKKNNYILRYVRQSKAETDAPKDITALMDQRRRWINGSWFALIDTLQKCSRIRDSTHKGFRKCFFLIQMAYFVLNVIFAWLNVGIYCLSYFILIYEVFNGDDYKTARTVLISIYVIILIIILLASLGVKAKHFKKVYLIIALIMGLLQIFIFILVLVLLIQVLNSKHTYRISSLRGYQLFAMIIALILFILIICFNLVIILNKQFSIVKRVTQYILLIPTYMNIFFIYSICNVNDCTWGNRPDKLTPEEIERVDEFKEFRTRWLLFWVFSNTAAGYLPLVTYKANRDLTLIFLMILGIPGIFMLILKVIGGVAHFFCDPISLTGENNKLNRSISRLDENSRL